MGRFKVLAALGLLSVLWMVPVQADSPLSGPTCTLTARYTATAANTTLVAHDGAHNIVVCYFSIDLSLHATTTAQLVWGTQSSTPCDTSAVSMSPQLAFGSSAAAINNVVTGGDGWGIIDVNPTRGGSDLCLLVSGTSASASGKIRYGLL